MSKTFEMTTKEELIHNAMLKLWKNEARELARHQIKLAKIRAEKDKVMNKCKHSKTTHIKFCEPQCVICGKISVSKVVPAMD